MEGFVPMKKHTIKKLFLAFSAFIMLFYSVFALCPVSSFAANVSCTFTIGSIRSSNWRVFIDNKDTGSNVYTSAFIPSSGATFTCDLPLNVPLELYIGQFSGTFYMLLISGASGMNYTKGGDFLGNTSRNFTIYFQYADTNNRNDPNALLHFSLIEEATPTATPTPTPTPTPQVATPTPDSEASAIPFPTSTSYPQASPLASDTDFWERMGQNANGAWGVITTFASGVMSNVVMRNLVIYLPLFGLIVGLIIYTITLGGGDDN